MRKNDDSLRKYYTINEDKILGSGSTGSVYLGNQIATGSPVAIKVIDLDTIDNQVSEYLLKMEKNALMALNHPNVLRCYHVFQQDQHCYLVTEYCNGGTLKDVIQQQGFLDQNKTIQLIEGLLNGYSQCIRKKVLHRDIKPANIMLHDGQPKLIDFGYCMIDGYTKPSLQYNVGSPSYMSPQCHQLNMYNEKTQMWAIGVTIYECLTGKTLDQGRKMTETFKELLQKGIYFPENVSQKCKKIIKWCLQYDPKNRPTSSQLLNCLIDQKPQEFLSELNENKSILLKNPSFSFLSSASPSSKPTFCFHNSTKNFENQQLRPVTSLYDSGKYPPKYQHRTKYQTPQNRNHQLNKFQKTPFLIQIKKDPPTKTQRAMNFMGNTNYFYNKLACNTFR